MAEPIMLGLVSGGVLFLFSGLQLWNHDKQKGKTEQNTED